MGEVSNIRFRLRRIQKTPDNHFKRELQNLYMDRSGKMPQMGVIERKKHFFQNIFWKVLVFLFCISLGVAAVNFFLLDPKNTDFQGEKVGVTVESPTQIPTGERFKVQLNFSNDENLPLREAKIILQAPQNFEVLLRDPETPSKDLTWELGSLPPGKRGSIEVEGILVGNIGDMGRFRGTLIYIPANFSSEFRREEVFAVEIIESSLLLSGTLPEKVGVEEEFSFSLKLENTTEEPVSDLSLEGVFPVGWILKKSEPISSRDDRFWMIDRIDPGKSFEVVLTGNYETIIPGGEKEFLFHVNRFSDATRDYVLQKSVSLRHKLTKDDLTLNLLNNGSTENIPISFGDSLEYTLLYKNKGDTDLKDVTLRLVLASDIIDWISFDEDAASRIEGTTLYWESNVEDTLTELKSGDEGIIRVNIPLIKNPEEVDGKKYFIEGSLQASLDGGLSWPIESNTITNRIESRVEVLSEAQKKDEKTYEIRLRVNNGLYELKDVLWTIPLANELIYQNGMSVSAGTLQYDETSRTVLWKIVRIPGKVTALEASFLVSFSKEGQEKGTPLTGAITFEAQNTLSNEKESLSLPLLSIE